MFDIEESAGLSADGDDVCRMSVEPPPQQDQDDRSLRIAQTFLKMLDRARTDWEFRTFDDVILPDGSKRRNPQLVTTIRGALKEAQAELKRMNARGAGVFVTINRTDGKGRKAENVTKVTSNFAEPFGPPIEPLLALKPHIVVLSSPGKFHSYWRVAGCELSQFKSIQQAIADKYGTDESVCDLPRVMRLPGFFHNKGKPFLVTLAPNFMDPNRDPYSVQEIVEGLGLKINSTRAMVVTTSSRFRDNTSRVFDGPLPPVETMRAMLEHLAKLNYFEHRNGIVKDASGRIIKIGWIECGMALKLAYGDKVGFELWSITHIDDQARNDAPAQWASFASEVTP